MRQYTKPPVKAQGNVVIERAEKCPGFMIMFPNGDVSWEPTKRRAELSAKRWFRENADSAAINVGTIDWRI